MRDFNKFHRYSANIGEMMERMGIDYNDHVASHFGPSMQTVIRSCQVCRSNSICSEFLANSPVAVANPPGFCPFADRLAELLEEPEALTAGCTIH
jgi:hypothetical protein